MAKSKINIEDLKRYVTVDKFSTEQIANIFDVSTAGIYQAKKRHNIKTPKPEILETIRATQRGVHRTCKRKHYYSYIRNLKSKPLELPSYLLKDPLEFGTAIHYALENYHRVDGSAGPYEYFVEYAYTTEYGLDDETANVAKGMLDYYVEWYPKFMPGIKTVRDVDGVELIEKEFSFPIKFGNKQNKLINFECHMDRVIETEDGDYYIIDYKTKKTRQSAIVPEIDGQASSYIWASHQLYKQGKIDKPAKGVIFVELLKQIPALKLKKDGGLYSNMSASSILLDRAHIDKDSLEQGSKPWNNIEAECSPFSTGTQILQSGIGGDQFISTLTAKRSDEAIKIESQKMISEFYDITSGKYPYPNPGIHCTIPKCQFLTVCQGLERGEDQEQLIEWFTEPRKERNGN